MFCKEIWCYNTSLSFAKWNSCELKNGASELQPKKVSSFSNLSGNMLGESKTKQNFEILVLHLWIHFHGSKKV